MLGELCSSRCTAAASLDTALVCLMWQGYRDCIAWLMKNGKLPYGVADADVSDTADSSGEVPAWRRRLQDTLASVQAQVHI